MKILNLKFKNINSLSGENEIDFTNPVFTNDGLFAITGKTGAGKSSILDAISLAFYGKTPRVDITGSENAVMTRGEKDCYSEIIFEVAGKKWKSSWKQERARTGTLKQVERVIADENNTIVADKISIKGERKNADDKTVNEKIVEILGLTFEQFTKVILLAQGSFAAFLQAKNDEKGELLEQITGTEIYAEISKKVFERNRTEKEKLSKVLVELEAIKIYSEEEIKNFRDEITAYENDKKQADESLQTLEAAKKWLADIGNLQQQIDEAKQKLPELEERNTLAKESFEKSENALKTVKQEQQKQEPLFKKVRELDTKISEKEKLLQAILKDIPELEKRKNELSKTLENQNSDLDKSQKLFIEKQNWANEHKQYNELVSNYAAIEKENHLLVNALSESNALKAKVDESQKDLNLKIADAKKTTEVFNEKNKNLTEKKNELESKKSKLTEILVGKELSKLQVEKENITTFGTQLKSLIEIEKAIAKNKKDIEEFDEKIKQVEKSAKELVEKMEADKKANTTLQDQINLLDENIKLSKTIQSLEEHRQHLKDGEQCPLCGSLEHPFALGNIPVIGGREKELADLKTKQEAATKTIQQDEKTQAGFVSDKANALINKEREEKALLDNSIKQKELLSEIESLHSTFIVPKGENAMESLNELLIQKREELKGIKLIISQATECENNLIKLRDKEIPALLEENQNAEITKNKAELAQKLAEQQLKTNQDLANVSEEKYKKEQASLLTKLKNYGVENIESLKKCLDHWNENQKQTEELKDLILTLNNNIALNKQELENQTKLLTTKQSEKQSVEGEKQVLTDERKECFAEKSVEAEENRLKQVLEKSEAEKTKAEKDKNDTHTEFEKNKAIVSVKEKDLLNAQAQKITEKTTEELQVELDEKKIKIDDLSQKIGANNQALKSNAENLENSGNKLKEKEKQQKVCNKWEILNNLIGSSDGKKYRNFAQALTFEHLIALSNRQLQKMSDRYILKRNDDSSNPFELLVIDKFQNSEERTAQNLSGGEKFIVSLSLALGLANMASKNMRIDTMFIDEGFGTLDSDYLDVALNALSNLQNEGKIIGVISHLTELKERIATHVEVVPSGNGHSKIQITN